jgi:hypothetical protein
MNKLQKIFDKVIESQIQEMKADLVRKKFQERGITLTEKQLRTIVRQLNQETFTVELDDEQLENAPEVIQSGLNLELSDDEIKKIVDEFSTALMKAIPASVDETADLILTDLNRRSGKEVKQIRGERKAFAKRVRSRWSKAIDLFELYLALCAEAGAGFNKHYRRRAAKKNDFVFDVLTRLLARGCQVGLEVLTLLEAGLADGAHARWRTLHEIACVAVFIKEHDQDVAERYLLHDVVESYKGANQYQQWCQELHHKRLPKRTMDKLLRNYDIAKQQFGKAFCSDYGWAAAALGRDRPRFSDIEKDVGLEKLRPYYKLASHNVHAGARGISFKLGLPGHTSAMLAGGSDAGLADPGHGAAISLLQITTTLILSEPTIDSLTRCAVLTKLERRIGDEFLKAHNALLRGEDET